MTRWSRTTDTHKILDTVYGQLLKVATADLDFTTRETVTHLLAYVKHERDAALLRCLAEFDRVGKIPRFTKKGKQDV